MKGSTPKRYIALDGKVSWRSTVDLPPDPKTGKRRQRRITARTKKEVDAKVAELLTEMAHGNFAEADASKITVGEFLGERWLPSIEHSLKPASLSAYRNVVNKHVEPALGRLALAKLGAMQLQQFYAECLETPLSPTTVKLIHRVLHRALKQAVLWRLLVRNPCDAVEAPREARFEYVTWTPEQAATFMAATAKHPLAALWRLALFTGMRAGEILGLRWSDVDFDVRIITVMQTLTRDKEGHLTTGTPKTAASRRRISLPASVVDSLRAHRAHQKEARLPIRISWNEQGFVFANPEGKPMHPSKIGYHFTKLVAAAGVPKIRFHDLRHTSATLMLANGENVKVVAERLGHSNVSMTLNRYSHVTADMQREASDRLDKLIKDAS